MIELALTDSVNDTKSLTHTHTHTQQVTGTGGNCLTVVWLYVTFFISALQSKSIQPTF